MTRDAGVALSDPPDAEQRNPLRLSTRAVYRPLSAVKVARPARPLQSLPHAVGGPGATAVLPGSPGRWECRPSIYSERVPEVARLNTP
jgi:hypothetical protein